MTEIKNVFAWQVRLYEPQKFDNPDWHGIQTVMVREFAEAVWGRINAGVMGQVEMMLLELIKIPHSFELLTQVGTTAKLLAPEAKSSIYPQLWGMVDKFFWPDLRRAVEGMIKDGRANCLTLLNQNRLAFTIKFSGHASLFPPHWEFPHVEFRLREVVLEGIIPVIVSLEPQLGSPMN